jgi:hypothetical protein
VAPRGNREKRSPQLPHRKPGWLDAPAIRQLRCQSSRKLLSYSRQNWIVSKSHTANNVVEVETSLGKKKLHSCVKPTRVAFGSRTRRLSSILGTRALPRRARLGPGVEVKQGISTACSGT